MFSLQPPRHIPTLPDSEKPTERFVTLPIDRRTIEWAITLRHAEVSVPHITKAQSASLEVVVWGFGPRVVLVHGSNFNGPLT
jgi:hypothetical protein